MTDILSISHLKVSFGNVHALKDISFNVKKASIVSLIGANGAGKTTILRSISGMVSKSGSIKLEGTDITRTLPHDIFKLGLVHAPEGRGIFPNLTVMENLQLGIAGNSSLKKNFSSNLEMAFHFFPRVKERLAQVAGTLSGGEQQMLAIARALLGEPKVLLLDEPSLGLAPQLVRTIFEIIKKINKENNVTILLVEQNANQALQISHYAYVLETGKIMLEGESKDLLANDQIRKIYLGEH